MELIETALNNIPFLAGTKNKIGILGGTFNPPHNGHLYMAERLYYEFGLQKVVLLPLGTPPHKNNITPAVHRVEMVRLLAKKHDFLEVCTIEAEREGYTYTVDTLSQLKKMWPDAELNYIIGSDTLLCLDSWKDSRKVLSLAEFICVRRPCDTPALIDKQIEYFKREYNKQIYVSRYTGLDISSTAVRDAIAKHKDVSAFLPEDVIRYMELNNVFR